MILKLRSKHLDLQEEERMACLHKKEQAISSRDAHGNPLSFHMLTDGFTAFRGKLVVMISSALLSCWWTLGQTPKIGIRGQGKELGSKQTQKFETRIIAVEVACGPIQTTFVYTTDNLQSGGASLMVDLMYGTLLD